jgi:hypothetical protein
MVSDSLEVLDSGVGVNPWAGSIMGGERDEKVLTGTGVDRPWMATDLRRAESTRPRRASSIRPCRPVTQTSRSPATA